MRLEEIARAKALDTIEIWFADEARIGQKNKITRRWAKRGTRPSAPRDQRTASTYIFGAVCPKRGKGAALILPACNTEAMNLQLAEIAAAEPDLQIIRRSRRPLLRGLEQARRSALAHHVHRIAPMGARVLINGIRY